MWNAYCKGCGKAMAMSEVRSGEAQKETDQQGAQVIVLTQENQQPAALPGWVAQVAVGGLVLFALFFGFVMGWLAK